MPSVYDIKPKFQALLRPLVARLAAAGVRPNTITTLAIAGSILVGALLVDAADTPALLLLMPAWLFIRMALNAVDGMLAREHRMMTPLGAVLNEAGDVISDVGLYLPLGLIYADALWPAVAFCFGAVMTEFCGLLGSALGGARRYEGPMGKSDRALIIGAMALGTYFTPGLVHHWPILLSIAAVLTALTCVNRVAKALNEARS